MNQASSLSFQHKLVHEDRNNNEGLKWHFQEVHRHDTAGLLVELSYSCVPVKRCYELCSFLLPEINLWPP
jgi:hypothetical protein